jgi:cytochrome c oxidase cbb3-type subunit 3
MQPPADSPRLPSGDEPQLRPHVYDGIQEFDQKLPNWWLLTLYGTIVFSIVYWFVHYESHFIPSDGDRVDAALSRIEAVRLAALVDMLDDDNLWQMSRNAAFVAAGRATYQTTCAVCHGANLEGGIGPALTDQAWVHGGRPVEVFRVIHDGVLEKGMPAWGAMLGGRKVAEVTAFVMSHHEPGEPIVQAPTP